MAAVAVPITSFANHIRPMDAGRDVSAVADLIELCFSGSLDADGKGYLRQMRASGRMAGFLGFTSLDYTPLGGYVWEDARGIVGNVSVMPFMAQGIRCMLIANVAVHPDYRGRGIATALTRRAMDHARNRGAERAWLQVRDDNPSAIHIYQVLGFGERARRTTWVAPGGAPPAMWMGRPAEPAIAIGPRQIHHWAAQLSWLDSLYPRDLSWHLPCPRRAFAPGLDGILYRLWEFKFPRHWAVTQNGKLAAALSWLHHLEHEDALWLAAPAGVSDECVLRLLQQARADLGNRRALNLNLPAGLGARALPAAGFHPRHTLIWMSAGL